jgi:putative tricarboxylic transport membrane protein
MDFSLFFKAFTEILSPTNLLIIAGSVTMGITVGALPGLTVTMGVALLLPLTFNFPTVQSFLALMGVYCGAVYGGSISAILMGIPGTPAAAATMFDGHSLAKKGLAGQALGLACIASTIGGLISALVMSFLSPQVARIALMFGPVEYFGMVFFALSILLLLSGKSLLKGVTSILLGLLCTTVGIEPILGSPRFTLGFEAMTAGLGLIPIAIGLFGLAQIFDDFMAFFESTLKRDRQIIKDIWPKWSVLKKIYKTTLKSTFIGIGVGIIPGIGPETASFMAYAEAKRASKNPELFGTGIIEGVVAPEAGNNGVTGGAMVPMMTLGIPGDAPTAILLGGFLLHGLPVGPMLFRDHLNVVYPIFVGFIVTNIFMGIIGLSLARFFARVMDVPQSILMPIICVLCFIGSYATRLSLLDVGISILFGLIGFFMKRYDFPLSPMLVSVILGPMLEMNMANALTIGNGSFWIFFSTPVGATFIGLGILFMFFFIKSQVRKKDLSSS